MCGLGYEIWVAHQRVCLVWRDSCLHEWGTLIFVTAVVRMIVVLRMEGRNQDPCKKAQQEDKDDSKLVGFQQSQLGGTQRSEVFEQRGDGS